MPFEFKIYYKYTEPDSHGVLHVAPSLGSVRSLCTCQFKCACERDVRENKSD